MEGRQILSTEGAGSTLRRTDQVLSKAYSTAAEPSGTARMTRKTGAHTAVICGTTEAETRWRYALRQNDGIVRS